MKTPRTDKEVCNVLEQKGFVTAALARQLERENIKLRKALNDLCESLDRMGLGESSDYPLPGEYDTARHILANVKVMAHPLARANVERGVGVEIRRKHRKQRG